MQPLEGKRVLITGGTGSLGQALVRRLLGGELGRVARVIVFSRDEAKQHELRLAFLGRRVSTDEVIYDDAQRTLEFRIGDVRNYHSLAGALREADVVFHAAALKQVPTCEYFPFEAVQTNVLGAENLVRAIQEGGLPVETVVGCSTDKACKPVNVMGMTKALQERVLVQANLRCPGTRFVCVRYGNVLASRGSVIPLFLDQIRAGGPVTVTTPEMTRFLLSLDDAVDAVFAAVREARPGDTYIPRARSARIVDLAAALIGDRPVHIEYTGMRPGEKVDEVLISDEERHRTVVRGGYYVILPVLPELRGSGEATTPLRTEYSSADDVMDGAALAALLERTLPGVQPRGEGEPWL